MIEYNVGLDETTCDVDHSKYDWMVYHYTIGDYCGDGEAVALGKDGLLYFWDLGHCSCYGPFESSGKSQTMDNFLNPTSIHEWSPRQEILEKVHELLLGV